MRSLILAAVTFGLLSVSPTYAQSDFSSLDAVPGDVVYVMDANGVEIGGALTRASSNSLFIGSYQFDSKQVVKIDRRGDSSWNGALVGAGVSSLLNGGLVSCGRCFARWIGFWSAMGWLIDRDHVGRTTIYRRGTAGRRSSVSPAVTEHGKGIAVVVGF
jgi:hypothetical protein